jgi:hypothetical protein
LFWWNLRDTNACEFFPTSLILLAPVIGLLTRGHFSNVLRAFVAWVMMTVVITAGSPQPVGTASVADIRYMVVAIPLALFIVWKILVFVSDKNRFIAILFASVLAFTNVVQLAFPHVTKMSFQSTLFLFLKELQTPQRSPYRETAEWLNQHAEKGETAWTSPNFAAYPLMFHASKVTFAWQLSPSKRGVYPQLSNIHFYGVDAPDYLIGFAQGVFDVDRIASQAAARGIQYEKMSPLLVYGRDMTRPELFWRAFKTVPIVNAGQDAVYVYRRRK